MNISNFVAKLPFTFAFAAASSPPVRMVHIYPSKQLIVDSLQPVGAQIISQSDPSFGQLTISPAHSPKSEHSTLPA